MKRLRVSENRLLKVCRQVLYVLDGVFDGKDVIGVVGRMPSGLRQSIRPAIGTGKNAERLSLARVRLASRTRAKRHASHAPASLQSKVSRSVPSPGHAPGDDRTNFSHGVVPCACPV
jgi:hypothetical protein